MGLLFHFLFYAVISHGRQNLTKLHNSVVKDTVHKNKFGPLVACFVVYVFSARVQEMVERLLITSQHQGFRCS